MVETNTNEQPKTKKVKLSRPQARPPFKDSDKEFATLVSNALVSWNDQKAGRVGWKRNQNRDRYAVELIQLHEGSLELEQEFSSEGDHHLPVGALSSNERVKHLGSGVFCEANTIPIDNDSEESPMTLTTAETRMFSRLCLQTMEKKRLVVGTGQPGIGKTRGALAYSLQELLWNYKTVIRAGFKTNQAYLFLPNPTTGEYEVWLLPAHQLENSFLCWMDEFRDIIILIDPPENAHYSCSYSCKWLKFASNNKDRHLEGIGKDIKVLIMKMPSIDEVQAMASVLWTNESNTKLPDGKLQNLQSPIDKATEIANRCSIVGCVPRLVFSEDFVNSVGQAYRLIQSTVNEMSEGNLLQFYKGDILLHTWHEASVSSKIFLLDTDDDEHKVAKISLNPISVFCARERLKEALAKLNGSNTFYFESICAMLMKGGNWNNILYPARREIQCGVDYSVTSQLIKDLGPIETGKLIRASTSYPILDFASTTFTWFDAKKGCDNCRD